MLHADSDGAQSQEALVTHHKMIRKHPGEYLEEIVATRKLMSVNQPRNLGQAILSDL